MYEGNKGFPLPYGDGEMYIWEGPYSTSLTPTSFDGNRSPCRAANRAPCSFAFGIWHFWNYFKGFDGLSLL